MKGEAMNCKHVFVGRKDGVHCKLCGAHMTADEYRNFLNPPALPEAKKPARRRTTKKKEEADD